VADKPEERARAEIDKLLASFRVCGGVVKGEGPSMASPKSFTKNRQA
jgi:hypothetical protein